MSLWAGGFVRLEPEPPPPKPDEEKASSRRASPRPAKASPRRRSMGSFGSLLTAARGRRASSPVTSGSAGKTVGAREIIRVAGDEPNRARSLSAAVCPSDARTGKAARLSQHQSALWSVLCSSTWGSRTGTSGCRRWRACSKCRRRSCGTSACRECGTFPRVRWLATRLDALLIERGLVTAEQLRDKSDDEGLNWEERWTPSLAEKLRLLFDSEFPGVHDLVTRPVWIAGEALRYGGDFNKLITSKGIVRQEGIIFRHLLRFILLCGEFSQTSPPDIDPDVWREDLRELADSITNCCRRRPGKHRQGDRSRPWRSRTSSAANATQSSRLPPRSKRMPKISASA